MASSNPSTVFAAKQAAGIAAAKLIEQGMLIGIGTGTTADCFINALIERVRGGLRISAVATSDRSAKLAASGGVEILDVNDITRIDMTVDGADEITPEKQMIKGGGGAQLREKIIAAMSDAVVIIIDPSKEVPLLGSHPLPVEIVPFAYRATARHIEEAGFNGDFRHESGGSLYTTDNGNYILDVKFPSPIKHPEAIDLMIREIPGVVETGFFFDLASKVIVGFPDGHTEIK